MITVPENIISLTEFKRDAANVVRRVRDEKMPAVLTVNGAASVVVLDAAEYQKIVRDAEIGSIMSGVYDGLRDMDENRGVALDVVFDMLKNDMCAGLKKHA